MEGEKEGGLHQIQPVSRNATVNLQFISDYTTTSSTGNNTAKSNLNKINMKTELTNTTTKLD